MKKVVILIGPPGSGKGTQSKILKEVYAMVHISTGDMLREEIANNTELGLKVKDIINAGGIVDDVLMLQLLESRLQKPDCNQGVILDGYPRTIKQAKMLNELLVNYGVDSLHVFEIVISEEVLLKRILGRITCEKCGSIYNEYYKQPKVSGVCDVCGSHNFSKRLDDNEETLKNRVKIYKEQSADIIKYYENMKKLHKIDGLLSVNDSKKALMQIIG